MKRIILSRTDSIGDVVLTLPMAGVLKKHLPGVFILFLGRSYTKPVIEACDSVDEFINWDAIKDLSYREQTDTFRALQADAIIHAFPVRTITRLAKQSGIPVRIATAHRIFTLFTCNHLTWFSRYRSALHEAQLNLKLLKPLGIDVMLSREEIPDYYGLSAPTSPDGDLLPPLASEAKQTGRAGEGLSGIRHPASQFQLILHPKSKGSAREWGLENFSQLIGLLPEDRFEIFITGTEEEGEQMKDFLKLNRERVTDLTGKLTLPELMKFIRICDGLVAASTGPLHLAAALGKAAIGLYAPMRPIWPARWAPLGEKAHYVVADKYCSDCRRGGECRCMKEIRPEEVAAMIRNARNEHQ